MSSSEILTFDQLFDLVEEDSFENETDKKIAQSILDAERDWRTSIKSLSDFINILEKEINGLVTESNLKILAKKYNGNIGKYSWESESVSYLLDIFKLTQETELKKVFIQLSEKVQKKQKRIWTLLKRNCCADGLHSDVIKRKKNVIETAHSIAKKLLPTIPKRNAGFWA